MEDNAQSAPERKSIISPLSNQTFSGARELENLDQYIEPIKILPDVNVIKIGGQSIMDRGRSALWPLIDEVSECSKNHELILCSGGGTRARHAYSLALGYKLPTGILAAVGMSTSKQNARILQMLFAKHGGVLLNPEDFEKLPLYHRTGCIPIMEGMPPYDFWEKPPEEGRIPPNRTDSGTYLTGEFLGARKVIYVKDEEGLYTDDPKKNKDAEFIPRISVQELFKRDLNDSIVEPVVLENMLKANHMKEIQIVNGLVKGNLTKALAGEPVGTTIYVEQ